MEVRVEHPHFSAPFAAGVAALVWAANPGLTGDDVERILLETAHTSPDATAGRYVNALAAVLAAANLPPELTVHRPDGGAQVPLNVPVTFVHRARTVHRGGDRPGQRRGDRSRKAGRRGGEHPARGRDHQAGPGEAVPPGTPYLVRATAADPNEPGGRVDCARLRWTSSDPADPFPVTGCGVEVTFPTAGPRTLTVTATDSHGATGTASVRVGVSGAPPDAEAPDPAGGG